MAGRIPLRPILRYPHDHAAPIGMFLLVLHIALYARLADAFLCWNDRLLLLVHLGRRVEMSADNAFDDQAYFGVRDSRP